MLWLYGKVKGWLAAAALAGVALGYAFMRGRSEGKESSVKAQHKAAEKQQEKFNEIDRKPVDVGAAYDGLRKRSNKR